MKYIQVVNEENGTRFIIETNINDLNLEVDVLIKHVPNYHLKVDSCIPL